MPAGRETEVGRCSLCVWSWLWGRGKSPFLQGFWRSLNVSGVCGFSLWVGESTATLQPAGLSHCTDVPFFPDLSHLTEAACSSLLAAVRHEMVRSLWFTRWGYCATGECLRLNPGVPLSLGWEIQMPCFLSCPKEFYCWLVRINPVHFHLFKFPVLNYWHVAAWWEEG